MGNSNKKCEQKTINIEGDLNSGAASLLLFKFTELARTCNNTNYIAGKLSAYLENNELAGEYENPIVMELLKMQNNSPSKQCAHVANALKLYKKEGCC